MTASDLITRIHHLGTNILGLLLFAIPIGMIFIVIPISEAGWRVASASLILVSILVPSCCDIAWRSLSEPRESLWRYVLPGSGGALVFIPVWLYFVALPITMVIALVKGIFEKG